jgi:hypothetical protein
VGDIVDVPFSRPRDRQSAMEHPDYYTLRERLISFLEGEEKKKAGRFTAILELKA